MEIKKTQYINTSLDWTPSVTSLKFKLLIIFYKNKFIFIYSTLVQN